MGGARKRTYDGRLRASRAAQHRDAVLGVALDLFMGRPYEDVTLQVVADGAGVALKTVMRQFGSKDALFLECVRRGTQDQGETRRVAIGDIDGAAGVLARQYEELGDMTIRYLALEQRFESVEEAITVAREFHLAWLGQVFSPWLPSRDTAERRRRLAQLFAATEIFVWWVWRNRLGMDRVTCELTMASTLRALIASWSTERG
jgi:AcrR family transcriptional regulator